MLKSSWSKIGFGLALALAFADEVQAQTFETAATQPGDKFHLPDYPVAFVSNRGQVDAIAFNAPRFGQDVIAAGNPAPQGLGGGLFVLLPDGSVEKLFPLPVHETAPGLIDTPLGELWKGAVVEPNMSEDGRTLYFAYFHDSLWEVPGNGGGNPSYKGSDLYRLDVGPLIDDPATDPATLAVRRLTFKQYTGNPKLNVFQTEADKNRYAVNPSFAQASNNNYWGNVDMHMIEMRTATGLKALWVSNRSRLGNSNFEVTDANHNFNLYVADILPDGSLGHPNQFVHYTTTSALSPAPLRDGFAFSYQSSTEGFRRWDIQAVSSTGVWAPLIGYAHRDQLFHLGTLVTELVGGEPKDSFLGVRYYNQNDAGFGQLHLLPMDQQGVNEFVPDSWGTSAVQITEHLTIGARSQDGPSDRVMVNGQWQYIGKFSSPRAGRIGGEYLMAYTPTSANTWLPDADGNIGIFESLIAYRPNLEPFRAWDVVDVPAEQGLRYVVQDSTGEYSLLWPTPLLSWLERTGKARQSFKETVVAPNTRIPRGLPFAEVGTSAIYNTDVRPYDCYLGSTGDRPFSPNAVNHNEEEALMQPIDGLRYVQDPNDFCKYLQPETVLAIGVNLTGNKIDLGAMTSENYETDGTKKKESSEVLGVFSVLEENYNDWSFMARIPANTPFDFHLFDATYGMKLVDVRSWHSLKPRERRTDCGGCHQHEAGTGIPFQGTEASRKPAMDMTKTTRFIAYDPDCKPVLQATSAPTVPTPEWKADVWPGFNQHCSSCHHAAFSTDGAALDALSYGGEKAAYDMLRDRHQASSQMGALGSPAFWAAYGERTDGRDNDLAIYQPNYANGDWGYRFSPIHATALGLCDASNPAWAEWVRTLGQWIDNGMPRNVTGAAYDYQLDRFHPAVDFGLTDDLLKIRIGWWDNRGTATVRIEVNGRQIVQAPNLANGSFEFAAASLGLTDLIRVTASDLTGNRQIVEKTGLELVQELALEPHAQPTDYQPVR